MPPTELSRKPLPCENVVASPKARERRPEAGLLKTSLQTDISAEHTGSQSKGEGLRPLTVVTVEPRGTDPCCLSGSFSAAQERKLVTPKRRGAYRSLMVATGVPYTAVTNTLHRCLSINRRLKISISMETPWGQRLGDRE